MISRHNYRHNLASLTAACGTVPCGESGKICRAATPLPDGDWQNLRRAISLASFCENIFPLPKPDQLTAFADSFHPMPPLQHGSGQPTYSAYG